MEEVVEKRGLLGEVGIQIHEAGKRGGHGQRTHRWRARGEGLILLGDRGAEAGLPASDDMLGF
jgi:hypothetical protein